MPQLSRPPHPHHHSHAEHQARQAHGRGQSAAAVSRHLHRPPRADYTLAHGGRQVRVGPVAFWIVVGTLVIMGVWSILTGTYFAFREDVLTGLIGRQANMQFAYEDRIAELRAQVDRITSRQLLDQEQFEQKLNALLKRQSMLEQRTNALSGDGITTGSIKPPRNTPPEDKLKPSPISDTVIFVAPPDREARLESRELPTKSAGLAARATAGGLDGILTRVSLSLDKIEQKQTAMLGGMEEKADNKLSRMRNVLSDLGVSVTKAAAAAHAGVGGPFVPLRAPPASASNFDRQLYRINVTRAEISQFTHALVTVPVRKPVPGEVEMSSPFGMRMDPFLGRPAIHTGLDLRGETGEPARATASGRITIAGRDGGYGNLVEINHGNGLSTRYGHLSEIDVKVGQQVTMGQTIGKIGSTGRSTGPHLHYETRINGEPVDPQKFLRAGLRLGNV
jgi:murein DD-endopeptidase MepM/ murein hydrolase activator NlpD